MEVKTVLSTMVKSRSSLSMKSGNGIGVKPSSEAKRANQSNGVKPSRLSPKHNSSNWNWQRKNFHSAASYPPFWPSMPVSYAPCPTSFHPYSSWEWNDPWAHTPSYFRQYHVEYVAPREPSCARHPYVENGRFEHKDRSRVQNKKKVVKQVYRVKRDGRKDKSLNLNSINEKPTNVLKISSTNGKEKEKLDVDPPSAKSEQKELKNHPLGLSNWQKKKLQKLSAQQLRKKGMARVSKRSIQIQNKDNAQEKGATQLKEKKRYERRSPKLRFAPNHQIYWSLHHPFALQMPHMPLSWNSSLDIS
uniref:Uncharacterized protein n=1 Tax=Setaria italica TaxID=4555 RepID=K3XRD0_SETIT